MSYQEKSIFRVLSKIHPVPLSSQLKNSFLPKHTFLWVNINIFSIIQYIITKNSPFSCYRNEYRFPPAIMPLPWSTYHRAGVVRPPPVRSSVPPCAHLASTIILIQGRKLGPAARQPAGRRFSDEAEQAACTRAEWRRRRRTAQPACKLLHHHQQQHQQQQQQHYHSSCHSRRQHRCRRPEATTTRTRGTARARACSGTGAASPAAAWCLASPATSAPRADTSSGPRAYPVPLVIGAPRAPATTRPSTAYSVTKGIDIL